VFEHEGVETGTFFSDVRALRAWREERAKRKEEREKRVEIFFVMVNCSALRI